MEIDIFRYLDNNSPPCVRCGKPSVFGVTTDYGVWEETNNYCESCFFSNYNKNEEGE